MNIIKSQSSNTLNVEMTNAQFKNYNIRSALWCSRLNYPLELLCSLLIQLSTDTF